MNIDEVTLLAYVDQQLEPAQRAQVNSAVAANPHLLAQLEALQASRLPYATAFNRQNLPLLPPDLAMQISAITSAAASTRAPAFAAAQHRSSLLPVLGSRRSWLRGGFAVAASFAAGYAAYPLFAGTPAAVGVGAASAAWIDAVANYQAMYTRATVEGSAQNAAQAAQVLQKFMSSSVGESADAVTLSIPDLSSEGFAFKRAQPLVFGENALLQMAYLPVSGKPAALCVLLLPPSDGQHLKAAAALSIHVERLHGLAMASWTNGRLAYALASELPEQQSRALAERIILGKLPTIVRTS